MAALGSLKRWLPVLGALLLLAMLASLRVRGGRSHARGGVLSEGTPIPPIVLDLSEGARLRLPEESGSRVVVLNFWATWCPPCRKEAPDLQRVAEWMEREGLGILVGVAADGASLGQVVAEARRLGMRYPIALPPGEAYATWGIDGLPTTVVLAPRGTVHAVHVGPIEEQALKALVRAAAKR